MSQAAVKQKEFCCYWSPCYCPYQFTPNNMLCCNNVEYELVEKSDDEILVVVYPIAGLYNQLFTSNAILEQCMLCFFPIFIGCATTAALFMTSRAEITAKCNGQLIVHQFSTCFSVREAFNGAAALEAGIAGSNTSAPPPMVVRYKSGESVPTSLMVFDISTEDMEKIHKCLAGEFKKMSKAVPVAEKEMVPMAVPASEADMDRKN